MVIKTAIQAAICGETAVFLSKNLIANVYTSIILGKVSRKYWTILNLPQQQAMTKGDSNMYFSGGQNVVGPN